MQNVKVVSCYYINSIKRSTTSAAYTRINTYTASTKLNMLKEAMKKRC